MSHIVRKRDRVAGEKGWGGKEELSRTGRECIYDSCTSFHPEVKAHKRFAMCETKNVPEEVRSLSYLAQR